MNTTLLFMGIGTQEFLFLALIILLLFGGKKIPELMKGIGKGVRSFKEGMNEVEDNLKETDQMCIRDSISTKLLPLPAKQI